MWRSRCLRPKFLNLNHNPNESLKLTHTPRICRCFCQSWCLSENKCTVASPCIYPCMCQGARVQHGHQVPERPNHSAAARSDQLTRSRSKQTQRRSGRHHYAAQRAVCPDPVWGPLLSADSNELPWVLFYRRPRVEWVGGLRVTSIHPHKHLHATTRQASHQRWPDTNFAEQRKQSAISPSILATGSLVGQPARPHVHSRSPHLWDGCDLKKQNA